MLLHVRSHVSSKNSPNARTYGNLLRILCLLMISATVHYGAPTRRLVQTGMAERERRPSDLYGDLLPDGCVARMGTLRFRTGQSNQAV